MYQPNKKKRTNKEKMTLIDKLEITGIAIAAVALVSWSVISLIPQEPAPVYQVYTDGVSQYLYDLDAETTKKANEEKTKTEKNAKETQKTKTAKKEIKKGIPEEKDKMDIPKNKMTEQQRRKETPPAENPKNIKSQDDKAAYVSADSVNIRVNPDKSSKSLGHIQKGEQIEVIETDNQEHPGWYKIKRDGIEGFVSVDFVEKK